MVTVELAPAMSLLLLRLCRFLPLDMAQVGVQAVEALLPELAVPLDPVVDVLERSRVEATGSPLRLATACDEARPLEHLEVLRDPRQGHVEGLGQLGDAGRSARQASQDGATSRIGERGEREAQLVDRQPRYTLRLIN